MPKLARFSTPAGLADKVPEHWDASVRATLAPYVNDFPQFYDPTKRDTPVGTPDPMVSWVAFPAQLTGPNRFQIAEGDRARQDEYCEWSAQRTGGKLTRVTFTTEVPEYYQHLLATDPAKLVRLYRKFVDERVELDDLRRPVRDKPNGEYRIENKWNTSQAGRLMHLMQQNNSLGAAVDLVARATEARAAGGKPVTDQQALVECARLGNKLRHSDPQIAGAVNVAARAGAEITFADPVGLYLGRPLTAGMITPDGTDAAKFWKIERGDAEHALRARFEVPASKGYAVGDIQIGGKPIQFGGQIAERVQIWVKVLVKKANHKPKAKPCGA